MGILSDIKKCWLKKAKANLKSPVRMIADRGFSYVKLWLYLAFAVEAAGISPAFVRLSFATAGPMSS